MRELHRDTHLRADLLSGPQQISFCYCFRAVTGQMTCVLRYVTKSLRSFSFAITWWMAQHLIAATTGNCGLISCHFQPLGVVLQPQKENWGASQWEILTVKSQPKDLHDYECWQLSPKLLEVIFFHIHLDHKAKKHCYLFEYFLEHQVQETSVIFAILPVYQAEKYYCKCEIIQ